MKKIGLIGLIGLIGIWWGAGAARAQSLALSISPPILEVMIKPGKSITQLYKLTNNAEPVVITTKLYELGTNGIKEDAEFEKEKWITLLSNDIEFDKPFLLGQNKEAQFLLKINPPAEIAEKDYYRALVFTTTPQLPSDTTMSSFSQNLASPVLITTTKTGILVKDAQIIRFEMPKIIDSFDALITDIDIKNIGKSYFWGTGKITLTGPVGRGSFDIIPSAILIGQTKKLQTAYGENTLRLPGFYIGKYSLELSLTLDEAGKKLSQVKTFYALPWKGILIILATVLVLSKSLKSLKSLKGKK